MSEIFLSYAHLDDKDPLEWITKTKDLLKLRLDILYGKQDDRIFIDYERKGNQTLSGLILSQLTQAKVLLSFVSPAYFASEWCRKEVIEFHNLKGGSAYERIVRVDKLKPNDDFDRINALELQIYKKFYDEEREYFFDYQIEIYKREVYKLAKDLKALLDKLDVDINIANSKDKIFLPECPKDREAYLEMIESGVYSNDFHLCKTPFYDGKTSVENWLRDTKRDIISSKCVVHILGQNYGFVPEDATHNPGQLSIFELQYNTIKEERMLNRFYHIVWKPKGIEAKDELQANFIKRMEDEHSSGYAFAEFVEKDIIDFQNYLKSKNQQFDGLTNQEKFDDQSTKTPIYFLFPYSYEETANRFIAKLEGTDLNYELKIIPKDLPDAEKHQMHTYLCKNIGYSLVMPMDNAEFRSNNLEELIPRSKAFHKEPLNISSFKFENFDCFLLHSKNDASIKDFIAFCESL